MAVSSIRTFCFCFIRRWPVPAKPQSQCHLPSSPSRSVPSSTFILPPVLLRAPLGACKLFSHASASALPLAGPWKLPASSPGVALFRGCSLYLLLFVRRLGRKEIRSRPNTPDSRTPLATFIAGWLMQVASVQAPIVEPSPSRTARATMSCVVRLPRHRCSVTARPWRRPVMFRFSHAYPPSGFRELRGSAARNPGPKKGFLGCCHR